MSLLRALKTVAVFALALALSAALLWYVAGTFLVNRTALAFMATFFAFAAISGWITADPDRRRSIAAHKGVIFLVGMAIALLGGTMAFALGGPDYDLVHGNFGLATVVFLAGIAIAFLPRAVWWTGRVRRRRD